MVPVNQDDLLTLLSHFINNSYSAPDESEVAHKILEKCKLLLQCDYNVVEVPNIKGDLSAHYPSQLLILENEIPHIGNQPVHDAGIIFESQYDVTSLRNLIYKARKARCRARFPVPVILYKGKNICRSATIACIVEVYGRAGLDYIFSAGPEEEPEDMDTSESDKTCDWHLSSSVRTQDINLLKRFNVNTIFDLMVENKKVKFGIYVTSSEKVDKAQRYSEFHLVNFPYPGCEFFKNFRDRNRGAEGLFFDWNHKHVDVTLVLPEAISMSKDLKIKWSEYKDWDLIRLTQNYVLYLTKYIQDNSSGILIHCISGWDRTPLFISLLRLSLWADGLIHQSLNEYQILYLTIAYDWMLFGHNLPDRIAKSEDIFFFCFYVLKFLHSDEFNVNRHSKVNRPEKVEKSVPRNEVDKVVVANVFRTDSDSQLELLLEEGLRGSNVSLNSVCSSISTKSQEPFIFSNGQDASVANCNEEQNGIKPQESDLQSDEEESCKILPQVDYEKMNLSDFELNFASTSNSACQNSFDSDSSQQEDAHHLNAPLEASQHCWSPQSKRTSPVSVPSSKIRQRQDSTSSGSWQVVTGTGSLRGSDNNSQDIDDLLRNPETSPNRALRLSRVREEFYKAYYKSSKVDYNEPSALSQMIGNIAEKVGL